MKITTPSLLDGMLGVIFACLTKIRLQPLKFEGCSYILEQHRMEHVYNRIRREVWTRRRGSFQNSGMIETQTVFCVY